MNYRSIAVPVKATQWIKEDSHILVFPNYDGGDIISYSLTGEYGATEVEVGDWIVEFPNGEIHVVRDKHFKQRFEQTEKFTKSELSYAQRLSETTDCA